jgi:hypothetical protein
VGILEKSRRLRIARISLDMNESPKLLGNTWATAVRGPSAFAADMVYQGVGRHGHAFRI